MKIFIITEKCCDIYRIQMITNLQVLLGDKHDVFWIEAQKKLSEHIKTERPDIVYFLIGGDKYNELVEVCKEVKAVLVAHVFDKNDIQINGEPEEVFPVLVEAIEQGDELSNVPGITYKHQTKSAESWNINQETNNAEFLTFSTRGCKGSCSFCNIKNIQGPLRFRDTPVVVADIINFSNYDHFQGHFRFSDPSFDSNPKKGMKSILKTLREEFPGYTYGANFRPDFHKMVDGEMKGLLFDSGLTQAFIGVESGNAADLKLYNKQTTVDDAQKTIDLFRSLDCAIDVGFIMANPFSDFDKLRQNVEFLKKNHLATFDKIINPLVISQREPVRQIIKDAALLAPGKAQYIFRENKVMMLMQTIQLIERELHQNALAQYRDLSLKEVKTAKRMALFRDGIEKYNRMNEFDEQLTEIFNRESDRLCEWFSNLLDLIERERPYREFFEMTFDYVTTEHIKSVVKSYTGLLKEMRQAYGESVFLRRMK